MDEVSDPFDLENILEECYEAGYCYDCGELNCTDSH
jgi:hypothetical protein